MTTNVQQKYVKLEQREHVLARPGMYISSIEPETLEVWLLNQNETGMEKRTIEYVPGLDKIFDEIVANTTDHIVRLKKLAETTKNATVVPVKDIKVTIDRETGVISVYNSGDGVDVEIHPQHQIYVPELIFGHLLTSTNFTETERLGAGTHGVGASLTNIFSEWFEIETVDANKGLIYRQRFENNMSVIKTPSVKSCAKKPYTKITFKPDYKRFGLALGLTDDMFQVMKKRVYDLCAITDADVHISFNGNKLAFKSFRQYVDLYLGQNEEHTRVHEQLSSNWEVVASYSNQSTFEQISFVNGILTLRGGKHVDHIVAQIVKKVGEQLTKKNKELNIRPAAIKDNLILFIKCTIVNPAFDSQSKHTLTTPISKFKEQVEVSDKFITKLLKTGLGDKVVAVCATNAEKTLKKSDGKRVSTIRGLPKLEDATWAGTTRSKECILILTEGDSAASLAVSGLSVVGREKYGVFPLRGKILNVRDASAAKIAENEEIKNLKRILGLEANKKYTDLRELRYGGIMLLSDQDVDGYHIRSLIMNLFHCLWPSLTKDFKFIQCMQTPIVKVRRRGETHSFYTLTDFENWKEHQGPAGRSAWDVKYYKGLGTSTQEEAKEYFTSMKKASYKYTGDASDASLDLAFNKKRADDRKAWLGQYDRQRILEYDSQEIPIEDFVHKELIHFSIYDVERSIPCVMDGLKTSQRKILYSCFKRNLVDKEIKVAQLAAYVAEQSAYHHGEVSLQGALVNMAQTFVGSNNLNLLKPNGQFGTRLHGGKDAAQARYIYTVLSEAATMLFKKADQPLLTLLEDDGVPVEPEFYVPVIPMILVNGAIGIGTGFSTTIPCFDPIDIINQLRGLLCVDAEATEIAEAAELVPWYRGFRGTIKKSADQRYVSIGRYAKINDAKIEITELPIGYWTVDFKADLEELLDKIPEFKKYENLSSSDNVHFILHFTDVDPWLVLEENGFTKLENRFNLTSTKGLSTSNMYAFNAKGQITLYKTVHDILREFCMVRLQFYQRRKDHALEQLQTDLAYLENKIRFIMDVAEERIVVHRLSKADLEAYLAKSKYLKQDGSYDYIIRIPVYNLTTDKAGELKQEFAKTQAALDALKLRLPKDIWLDELAELEKVCMTALVETPSNKSANHKSKK